MATTKLVDNVDVSAPTISPSAKLVGNLDVTAGVMTIRVPADGFIRMVLEVSNDDFNADIFQAAVNQIDHRLPFKTEIQTVYFGLGAYGGLRVRLNVTDVIGTCTVIDVTLEA